jgi:hypothetical protein
MTMSEISSPESTALDDEQEGLPHSCYLLEFSVSPGGARRGDIFVGNTLDEIRECLARREGFDGVDDYLIIWYGAVLHLWVVQQGSIAEGIDLHHYLRTGDERCDQTLARLLVLREDEDSERWDQIEELLEERDYDCAQALPLLTRVLELQDRIEADTADADAKAELDRILQAAEEKQAPIPFGGVTVEKLSLDWTAIAEALPPLRDPILSTDRVSVRWADPGLRHRDSYLHVYTDPTEPVALHRGLNDHE